MISTNLYRSVALASALAEHNSVGFFFPARFVKVMQAGHPDTFGTSRFMSSMAMIVTGVLLTV